jgi:UDP-N-acetylglucosamine 2-epimerase (non-hydrolysing)
MKKKILTILGTRPELIKMFPIINKLDKKFDNKLVWSGQHYDYTMVKKNFNDDRHDARALLLPDRSTSQKAK